MDIAVVGKQEHVSGKTSAVKTEDCPTSSLTFKSEFSKKATNKDLPKGAKPFYRSKVVTTILHWAAGNVADPFTVDERQLVQVLGVVWTHVFGNSVSLQIPTILSLVM